MTDWTPHNNRAEWHVTYRCDLSCANCNRACFLPAQTPDMTLDDAREFMRQSEQLAWYPDIVIMGGEPTLHPDLFEFIRLANQHSPGRVTFYSNGFSKKARECIDRVRREGTADVPDYTFKPLGSVIHEHWDIFIAPDDFGRERMPTDGPCLSHSSTGACGISVDHEGYTVCCMGGAIDGVLGLGVRTKRLADLFQAEFADRQTRALCAMCGQHLGATARQIGKCTMVKGTLLSPAWAAAAERIHGKGCK